MKSDPKKKTAILPGQLYISDAETELGPGIVLAVEGKTMRVFFPASETVRNYGMQNSPLRRVIFAIGDEVKGPQGETLTIESMEEREGIHYYRGGHPPKEYPESQLTKHTQYHSPEERLFHGQVDSLALYDLRSETLEKKKRLLSTQVRGLMGGRMALLPHQLYVVTQVAQRAFPRVLLADEVGLGKTIEAGLILHHLAITGRVERALILVPPTLVHQWFVEMLRRFQLPFRVLADGEDIEDYLESPKGNPFEEDQMIISSLEFLAEYPFLQKKVAAASWDLLIVDEAHRISWAAGKPSGEYLFVETLAQKTPGVLLLTGTPEQLVLEGHFGRLHLLDPQRFPSYEAFLQEYSSYSDLVKVIRPLLIEGPISPTSVAPLRDFLHENFPQHMQEELFLDVEVNQDKRRELLRSVLDLYGTGRVFFRNTRTTLKTELSFFPKRILKSYPLGPSGEGELGETKKATSAQLFEWRLLWLAQLLRDHPQEKILLIAQSKSLVLNLEKYLRELTTVPTALFYDDQTLMNRDRQAAYFADPQGAQILLCTEMGSEGRNFQFAHHLVLFDLPTNPDLLEQRIGRLDRIGQKDNITIHVPYIQGTSEELLFTWYHQGFDAFQRTPTGGQHLYQQLQGELEKALQDPRPYFTHDRSRLREFIAKTQGLYAEIAKKFEEGRDLLAEYLSFDEEEAKRVVQEIGQFEEGMNLRSYMERVFELLGVHSEDLGQHSCYLKPNDNMYVPHFPGLGHSGLSITYNRPLSLEREDLGFLTWDHPMVTGAMDLILDHHIGNVSMGTWKNPSGNSLLLETIFVAECVAPKKWEPHRYFPPSSLRLVLDMNGQDVTEEWPRQKLREMVADLPKTPRQAAGQQQGVPKEFLRNLIRKGQQRVQFLLADLVKAAKESMERDLDREMARLQELQKKSASQITREMDFFKEKKSQLLLSLSNAQCRLDSLKLIL